MRDFICSQGNSGTRLLGCGVATTAIAKDQLDPVRTLGPDRQPAPQAPPFPCGSRGRHQVATITRTAPVGCAGFQRAHHRLAVDHERRRRTVAQRGLWYKRESIAPIMAVAGEQPHALDDQAVAVVLDFV
jgi:hypothetical protein